MLCSYLEQGRVYTKKERNLTLLSTVLLIDCYLTIKIFGKELTELESGPAEGDDLQQTTSFSVLQLR